MSGKTTEDDLIDSTRTSFRIIEQIKENGRAGISGLAVQLDLPKSTVHRHVKTLSELGYLVREENGYRLGLRFLDLGDQSRSQQQLFDIAKPEVDELIEDTGERAQIMVEENGYGVYIYQTKGERAVKTDSHTGTRVHLHATAVGKAYLANLPRDRIEEIVEETGLPAITSETITDSEDLFAELETVRDRGVAFNDEEKTVGMRAVGAPICRTDTGEVLGALSFSAPTTRFSGPMYETDIPERVQSVAQVIGLKATYS